MHNTFFLYEQEEGRLEQSSKFSKQGGGIENWEHTHEKKKKKKTSTELLYYEIWFLSTRSIVKKMYIALIITFFFT